MLLVDGGLEMRSLGSKPVKSSALFSSEIDNY